MHEQKSVYGPTLLLHRIQFNSKSSEIKGLCGFSHTLPLRCAFVHARVMQGLARGLSAAGRVIADEASTHATFSARLTQVLDSTSAHQYVQLREVKQQATEARCVQSTFQAVLMALHTVSTEADMV